VTGFLERMSTQLEQIFNTTCGFTGLHQVLIDRMTEMAEVITMMRGNIQQLCPGQKTAFMSISIAKEKTSEEKCEEPTVPNLGLIKEKVHIPSVKLTWWMQIIETFRMVFRMALLEVHRGRYHETSDADGSDEYLDSGSEFVCESSSDISEVENENDLHGSDSDVESDLHGSNPNVEPDLDGSNPSIVPDLDGSNPGIVPDLDGSNPSVVPDLDGSNPGVVPDLDGSNPNDEPDLEGSDKLERDDEPDDELDNEPDLNGSDQFEPDDELDNEPDLNGSDQFEPDDEPDLDGNDEYEPTATNPSQSSYKSVLLHTVTLATV